MLTETEAAVLKGQIDLIDTLLAAPKEQLPSLLLDLQEQIAEQYATGWLGG
jgi:hypothetical protein